MCLKIPGMVVHSSHFFHLSAFLSLKSTGKTQMYHSHYTHNIFLYWESNYIWKWTRTNKRVSILLLLIELLCTVSLEKNSQWKLEIPLTVNLHHIHKIYSKSTLSLQSGTTKYLLILLGEKGAHCFFPCPLCTCGLYLKQHIIYMY